MSKYLLSKLEYSFSQDITALAGTQAIALNLPAASAAFFGAKLEACVTLTAGTAVLTLIEAATATDGAATTPLNKMRIDTPPVSPVPCFAATVIVGGTSLAKEAAAVSQPAEICGWILKPGVKYILQCVGAGPASGVLSLGLCVIPNFDYLYKGNSAY